MLTICKFLLRLYPASFRSRVEASMLQTIRDSLANGSALENFRLVFDLTCGAAIENVKTLEDVGMSERIFNRSRLHLLGFLLSLPGIVLLTLLMLGIEPSFGLFDEYLKGDDDFSKTIGSLFVLGTIVVLPTIGVLIATRVETAKITSSILTSAAFAMILVAPLIALQFTHGRSAYSEFPYFLFAVLWILPAIAIYIMLPVVSRIRSANGVFADPLSLALRLVAVIPIAVMWFALVQDQMPCFLGVPNCD